MRKGMLTALAALGLLAFAPSGQGEERRYTIGTNPPGTVYFAVGTGMAKLMQEKLGKQVTVQPGGGSSTYLPLVETREVTMGLSSSLDSGGAYRGEQGRKAMKDLRAIARLWPLAYAYMVPASSGLSTVGDLKGKRAVVTISANAALAEANVAMLAAAGLTPGDVRAVTIGAIPQGVKAVIEGNADATPVAVGIPLVKEAHAAIPGGVRYLALSGAGANAAFLGGKLPGLYPLTVKPAPHRPEIKQDTTVLGFDVFLVASGTLSDADVTAIVSTLHGNWAALQKDYPALRGGPAAGFASATNTVPYHAAAAAYFKSKGLWTPANDKVDATLGK